MKSAITVFIRFLLNIWWAPSRDWYNLVKELVVCDGILLLLYSGIDLFGSVASKITAWEKSDDVVVPVENIV